MEKHSCKELVEMLDEYFRGEIWAMDGVYLLSEITKKIVQIEKEKK